MAKLQRIQTVALSAIRELLVRAWAACACSGPELMFRCPQNDVDRHEQALDRWIGLRIQAESNAIDSLLHVIKVS